LSLYRSSKISSMIIAKCWWFNGCSLLPFTIGTDHQCSSDICCSIVGSCIVFSC
jgi:hypothetical protein